LLAAAAEGRIPWGRNPEANAAGDWQGLLARGPSAPADRARLEALFTLGLLDGLAPDATFPVAALAWLATQAHCDVLGHLAAWLPAAAQPAWWQAVGEHVSRALEQGQAGDAAALALAIELGRSRHPEARRLAERLEQRRPGGALGVALRPVSEPMRLSGRLVPAPLPTVWFVLGSVSLLLPLWAMLRAVLTLALGLRTEVELRMTPKGVELQRRRFLLGRNVSERRTTHTLDALMAVERQSRFARLPLYAGLAALALGTWFGLWLMLDGASVQGGSMSLIGAGALVLLAGLAADLLLTRLSDWLGRRTRLLLVPRRGRRLCVAGLEENQAEHWLEHFTAALAVGQGSAAVPPPPQG